MRHSLQRTRTLSMTPPYPINWPIGNTSEVVRFDNVGEDRHNGLFACKDAADPFDLTLLALNKVVEEVPTVDDHALSTE